MAELADAIVESGRQTLTAAARMVSATVLNRLVLQLLDDGWKNRVV